MKKTLLGIVVIFALIIPSGVALAEGEEPSGELQLILDFRSGHEINLYLPPDVDTALIIDEVLELAGEGADIDYTYKDEEEQIIYVSAPNLITEKGRNKTFSRDLSTFFQVTEKLDLDIIAYLVMERTQGLFSYTINLVDLNQKPLTLAGSDEWELWWEIPMGVSPGFQATLDLDLNLSWSAFWSVYILMVWFAIIALGHRRNRNIWKSRWLYVGHWIVTFAVSVSLLFTGWFEYFEHLYLDPRASRTPFIVLLVILFLGFMILTTYMRQRVSTEGFSIKEYLLRYSFLLLYGLIWVLLILLAVILWPIITGFSPWLGLGICLLGIALLPGQIQLVVFRLLGTRELHEPETSHLIEELASKLNVKIGKVLIVPERMCKIAYAAIFTHRPPNLLITDYLWSNLDNNEKCFIIAHELAHVRLGYRFHVWAYIITSWIVSLGIMLPAWINVTPLISLAAGFVIAWLFLLLIIYPRLRTIELNADNLALSVSENPEAAISALKKLEQLNSHLNVNKRTTHPTMTDRISAIEQIDLTIPSR